MHSPPIISPAAFSGTFNLRTGWTGVSSTTYLTYNSITTTVSDTFYPGQVVDIPCSWAGSFGVLSLEVRVRARAAMRAAGSCHWCH